MEESQRSGSGHYIDYIHTNGYQKVLLRQGLVNADNSNLISWKSLNDPTQSTLFLTKRKYEIYGP